MLRNNKIPDGWEVEKLGKLCKTFSGGTPSIDKPEYYNGNIPFIRSGEIHSNETELFLTDLGLKNSSAKIIEKGDLLVALYGATSGEVSISKISGAINQALLCIKSNKFDNVYLKHLLLNKKTKIINKYLQGGQGNLSAEIIKSIKFAFPPLSEQKKIAEILSSWDKAIELLDRKIDLRNQQKKYLMQILLTGYTRLSGFTAPWREVKQGDILKNISKRNKIGIKRVLSISNKFGFILPEEYFSKYISSKDLSNYKIISKNEFAYNPARINVGSIAKLTDYNNGVLSPMYVIFKCVDIHTDYFYHWLKTYEFNKKVCLCSQGSVRETVDFNSLSSIKLKIPTDIKEQEKIAEILTLADDEISLLRKKKELIKQQKKYLMQTLLTGQIRVSV